MSPTPTDGDLEEIVREHAPKSVRAVATYERTDYELVYIRDDVRARYTDEELDDLLEALIFDGLHEPYLERLFDMDIRTQILGHETGYVCHYSFGPEAGAVVSVDREGFSELEALTASVMDLLGE